MNELSYAVVEELCKFGATVHTCARKEADLREWQAKGFRVTGSTCDVSSPAEREKFMTEVSSVFGGKLDILVSTVYAYLSNRRRGMRCDRSNLTEWLALI